MKKCHLETPFASIKSHNLIHAINQLSCCMNLFKILCSLCYFSLYRFLNGNLLNASSTKNNQLQTTAWV